MEIQNPRRILAVSSADASQHLARVIKDLTGAPPEPAAGDSSSSDGAAAPSLAGTTHPLALRTAYYAAEVPVWLDLVAPPAADWAASFLSAEAREVLDVLGGVVVVFALPPPPSSSRDKQAGEEGEAARELVRAVGRVVREGLGGWEWDGVGLGVGVSEVAAAAEGAGDDGAFDEWEDCCAEWGLEFVQVRPGQPAKNEFGEKTGISRVLEALEANDWSPAPGADDDDDLLGSEFGDFEGELAGETSGSDPAKRPSGRAKKDGAEEDGLADLDPESLDFGFDREDFAGLKRAIWNAGQDDDSEDHDGGEKSDTRGKENPATRTPGDSGDSGAGAGGAEDEEKLDGDEVQKLERMMVKLQAVRDMSAGLPEDQRRRMAARAVGEVMKEL